MDTKTKTYIDEIAARGGETSIFSTPWGRGRSAGFEIPLAVAVALSAGNHGARRGVAASGSRPE